MVKFQWFSLEKRVKYKINEKKMEGEHMRLHFTKMEGLGNDYVYVNCFKEKVEHPSELAVRNWLRWTDPDQAVGGGGFQDGYVQCGRHAE